MSACWHIKKNFAFISELKKELNYAIFEPELNYIFEVFI